MPDSRDFQALLIFEKLLDVAPQSRAQLIDSACGDDTSLREKVEGMLAAHESAEFPGDADFATELTPGKTLANRYVIRSLLGTGGMGQVWRATDQRLERDVAIKMLSPTLVGNESMRQRFERELKAVALLSHPNVMAIHDILDLHRQSYAVMEYIDGVTLRHLMATEISTTTAVETAAGIADGLSAAHEQNVMHRDIKPENIIVTKNGSVKVLDFGLARAEIPFGDQNLTRSGIAAGTVPYMSPEQASSKSLTCATDIFSLGTVLYEMLTGFNPFRDDGSLSTLQRVAAAAAPALPVTIPTKVGDIVARMMSVDPESRPTAAAVAEQLRSSLEDSNATHVPAADTSQVDAKTAPNHSAWQPSMIIIPFQNLGDDSSLEVVADGLVENLNTVLTRVPMLKLTSRLSSFSLKGQTVTAEEVRKKFDADYMVEGSLQRFGDSLRANVQLIETRSQSHVWAQQFYCPNDLDAVKTLVQMVLSRLEPQLLRAIVNDAKNRESNSGSRPLVFRAMSLLNLKGWNQATFSEAAELLRRSVSMEPEFPLSHAYLALIRGLAVRIGVADDEDAATREAIEHADEALDLDDMDSNILGLTGCALADVGESARAIPLLRQAIELNPNNAQAYAALGTTLLTDDQFTEAISSLKAGIALSPCDGRLAVWYASLAVAFLLTEQLDEAHEAAQSGCASDRKSYLPRVVLTAIHIAREDGNNATAALQEALRLKPDLSKKEIASLVGRRLSVAVRKLMREV